MQRDRANDSLLTRAGWHVLRFWEHEAPEMVVAQIRVELAALKFHSVLGDAVKTS
jgi:DNA mismatch endonuclease (patch repair protein)